MNIIIRNPLEQFEVSGFIFTNMGIFIILNIVIMWWILRSQNTTGIIMNRSMIWKEAINNTVIETVKEQIGRKEIKEYPIMLTIFLFILISNYVGMVPYSFTPTSHLVVTIGMSVPIMIGITIIGWQKNKGDWWGLFLPVGTPLWLIPLLTTIELISYIARAFSLGIRLFANIVAGHALIHILAGFSYKWIISEGGFMIIKLLPILIISVFIGLEMAIAGLQAYVFVTLTASYIKDVL